MSAEVLNFTGISRLDRNPDRVLGAAGGELKSVVLCGYDKDGDFYFSSSLADGAEALWLLERARHKLMHITDRIESGECPV